MRLLDTPNDQTPNRIIIETTCCLEIIPKMAARHKYLPSLSTTCHVNPKKETNGQKASFLTRLLCPDKIARLKGGHCRDHPQTHVWQHRRAFLYGTPGTSTLYPDSLRGAYGILKLVIRTTPLSCPDPVQAS